MRRPGIWKQVWKGAIDSFVEGMLATNPVAYVEYRRCKAGVDEQISMAPQELGLPRLGGHERGSAYTLGELLDAALGERVVEHGGP